MGLLNQILGAARRSSAGTTRSTRATRSTRGTRARTTRGAASTGGGLLGTVLRSAGRRRR